MKKAIIYSRVSSNSQSTKRQVNELKSLTDYEVVEVFTESLSAFTKSISERPELVKAIDYAIENKVDYILVHEISRLGRKTEEVLNLLQKLKQKKIKVYIKTLGFAINEDGTNEALNKLLLTIMADIGRMESEQLSLRIKSGLDERKRQGLPIGRQYGTIESRDQFLKKPINKKILNYLNTGESIRWISHKLKVSPTTVQKVKKIGISAS